MQFCPKCKKIMKPSRTNGKLVFTCTNTACGHVLKKVDKQATTITSKSTKREDVELAVVDEKAEARPIVEVECRACGNTKAYFWSKQTRAADEAETRFFRCTKCSKTWREYD
ncbi:MAG: transcription factor S [Candidatus Woesearchaeota archaeon]